MEKPKAQIGFVLVMTKIVLGQLGGESAEVQMVSNVLET